jgi:hypothetical protein
MTDQPPEDAVPESARAFLFTHVSGGDDGGRRWQAVAYLVPVGLAGLWTVSVGPFHGVWRLLGAVVAAVLAYVVEFPVIMSVMLVRASLAGRQIRRDPKGYFVGVNGFPSFWQV